ncbi:MAG: hypothetical protein P8X51_04215, partial [Maritimibacter sp.]
MSVLIIPILLALAFIREVHILQVASAGLVIGIILSNVLRHSTTRALLGKAPAKAPVGSEVLRYAAVVAVIGIAAYLLM